MAERVRITLVCDECGARNYDATKKHGSQERLSLKKFCSTCGRHTVHKESR